MTSPTDKLHHLLPQVKPLKGLRSGRKFITPRCRTDRFGKSLIMWALKHL